METPKVMKYCHNFFFLFEKGDKKNAVILIKNQSYENKFIKQNKE